MNVPLVLTSQHHQAALRLSSRAFNPLSTLFHDAARAYPEAPFRMLSVNQHVDRFLTRNKVHRTGLASLDKQGDNKAMTERFKKRLQDVRRPLGPTQDAKL